MQLKNLETKPDNAEDVGDVHNALRYELAVLWIEEETLRGNIIRSRAQLTEENEKCSKYFMNLENINYKSKCRRKVQKAPYISAITNMYNIMRKVQQDQYFSALK